MTPEQEEAEILRNARAAHKAKKIDLWQLWSVYWAVAGIAGAMAQQWGKRAVEA